MYRYIGERQVLRRIAKAAVKTESTIHMMTNG